MNIIPIIANIIDAIKKNFLDNKNIIAIAADKMANVTNLSIAKVIPRRANTMAVIKKYFLISNFFKYRKLLTMSFDLFQQVY